jgi:carbon monoxide dehydrogenase subunit G
MSVMVIKTGRVARIVDVRNEYKILASESEGSRLIWRARFNPGNNIKIDIL